MLLNKVGETDPNTLEDLILIMAKNIERALMEGGAAAGKDYTIHDLYAWSMPFALEVFRSKDAAYTVSHF